MNGDEDSEVLYRGEPGARGERGEPGQSFWNRSRQVSAIALVVIFGALTGVNLFWNASNTQTQTSTTKHLINQNDSKFCGVVGILVTPVPRPANPAANPSREVAYTNYLKAAKLYHDLGCRVTADH